eukprot:1703008-Pyramimonas_sp.AAC.1
MTTTATATSTTTMTTIGFYCYYYHFSTTTTTATHLAYRGRGIPGTTQCSQCPAYRLALHTHRRTPSDSYEEQNSPENFSYFASTTYHTQKLNAVSDEEGGS